MIIEAQNGQFIITRLAKECRFRSQGKLRQFPWQAMTNSRTRAHIILAPFPRYNKAQFKRPCNQTRRHVDDVGDGCMFYNS